jgi:exonuclease III
VWLVNVYTPNSGEGLKRLDYRVQQWDKALASFIKVGPSAHVCCAGGRSRLDSVNGRQQGRERHHSGLSQPRRCGVCFTYVC